MEYKRKNALLHSIKNNCKCNSCAKIKDLSNCKFGRLTALFIINNNNNISIWKCKCDCGKTYNVPTNRLLNRDTKSCGCLLKEKTADRASKNYSNMNINNINIIKKLNMKNKNGYYYYTAECPICKRIDWKINIINIKNGAATKCKRCLLKQTVSKTCKELLDKVEKLIKYKIIREHFIENYSFDVYIKEYGILIESDGRYYHSFKKRKNIDSYKNKLAVKYNLKLIGVENDNTTDYQQCINKILNVINFNTI